MTPAAGSLSLSSDDIHNLAFVAAGLLVFFVFLIASRVLARFVGQQLLRRAVRTDMIVIGRRVVYVVVIAAGVLIAFSLAFESANVTLIGILLATVVAALGVQDLLRDYVSGYYVLLEHHIRVGDRISMDGHTGEVVEVKLRVTLVRAERGDLLVVPNSELFTKPVLVLNRTPDEVTKPSEPQG